MTMATNFDLLLLGRIVTGLGVGISFVVVPVYIAEITPSSARGMLTTCFDISINVGIVLGYVVGYYVETNFDYLSHGRKWRLMLGLGGVLPVVVMICLAFLPESPRWLMAHGRDEEAHAVLVRFLGDSEMARDSIDAIRVAMVEDEEASSPGSERCCEEQSIPQDGRRPSQKNRALSWAQVLGCDQLSPGDKYLRRVVILVVGVGFW
jgi:MFS family permease